MKASLAASTAAPILLAGCQTGGAQAPESPAVESQAKGWRPVSASMKPRGANEDVRMAICGLNGQGSNHLNQYRKMAGVRVVALCDADEAVLGSRIKGLEKDNIKPKGYTDIRKMLEDPEIDAVSVATPNHWHSLMGIWILQSGKDAYVEKPISHNVYEGRKFYEATLKYPERIAQAGTQSRSDEGLAEAFAILKKGELGKILLCRGLCYKRRNSIGKTEGPQPIPPTVNYDLWCGPAPMDPLRRKKLHYDWHWFWATGSGDIGNQGIHQMDVARWASGNKTIAPRVMSIGGRFGYEDDAETPNTQIAFYDYPEIPVIFEVYGLPYAADIDTQPNYKRVSVGNIIHCEGGYFAGGWFYDNNDKQIKQIKLDGGGKAFSNFIKAVRSRKKEDIKAPILECHLSSALCHMGNISYRLGKEFTVAEVKEQNKSNKSATETYERMLTHLEKNKVLLSKKDHVMGPWLQMNTKIEKFEGPLAAEANKLVSRKYREPYVVMENV
ncbi:MAG: Gfo/Idh/MocA family oxidoreductase [Candidatus Sumerlaeota bacterium]|nr:Gfo/Idh/MocA family oxidoreductase [Candidatus Sumerlaeota bacterium]